MNNYRYIVTHSLTEVADFLCKMIDNMDRDEDSINNCEICPARDDCHKGHNGFMDFLRRPYNEGKLWKK